MKTYRDYLDRKEVPRGPWCILELNNPVVKPIEIMYDNDVNKESQNGLRQDKTPTAAI